MSGKPFITEAHSDTTSDHYLLVREARHPRSDGGVAITDREAACIEESARGTVKSAERVRVTMRKVQYLFHNGPLAEYEPRIQREVEALRRMDADADAQESDTQREMSDVA